MGTSRAGVAAGPRLSRSENARRWIRPLLSSALPPLVVLAVLVLAWQGAVWGLNPDRSVVPSPGAVASTIAAGWATGSIPGAIATSLARGAIGFAFAVLIATPLALLISEFRLVRRGVAPLITGLQTLPSVAWVPAAILWFGVTDATVYFVILMGAVPSIINGLLTGIDQVLPLWRRLGATLGASRWQLVWRIVLPGALPGYLGGLKQGWAFAWRGLMAAEIIASSDVLGFGLGTFLQSNRDTADVAGVSAALLTILFVGLVVEAAIFGPLERRLLQRRGLAPR